MLISFVSRGFISVRDNALSRRHCAHTHTKQKHLPPPQKKKKKKKKKKKNQTNKQTNETDKYKKSLTIPGKSKVNAANKEDNTESTSETKIITKHTHKKKKKGNNNFKKSLKNSDTLREDCVFIVMHSER